MKKLFLAIAFFSFIGLTYALPFDGDKKCDKKECTHKNGDKKECTHKDGNKKCCTDKKADASKVSCSSSEKKEGKSCCASKAKAENVEKTGKTEEVKTEDEK